MNAISPIQRIRRMDFLGPYGHVSFGWTPENDEWVLPMIEEKMKVGFVFRIVERNNFANMGVFEHEVEIKDIAEIGSLRRVLIHDDDARKLIESGKMKLTREFGESEYTAGRVAKTAAEVVRNDTIAHRPARGG